MRVGKGEGGCTFPIPEGATIKARFTEGTVQRLRMYGDAVAVQSACNVAGIVNSLAEVRKGILAEIDAGEWRLGMADHPVLKLFLHQLCFLTCCGAGLNDAQWHQAYEYCKARA